MNEYVTDEDGHTKRELLELGRQLGASEKQFDRWRRAQLLPPPISHRSLGRGKGSVSIYPPGTSKQLRRLCELHCAPSLIKKERRLLFLAWKLWWEGYDIPALRVREFLAKHVVNSFDSDVEAARAMSPEQRQVTVHELATKPLGRHPGPLGKARGHLRGNMRDFLALLFTMVDGNVITSDPESLRLLEKASGLERGRTDTWCGQPLLTDEKNHIPDTIVAALMPLLDGSLTQRVEQMSDAELCEARQTAQRWWNGVTVMARFGRDARGKGGFGLGDFLYAPSNPREQAAWCLMFGMLNEAATNNSAVADIFRTFFTALETFAANYPLVEAGREVEPFRELLSPARIEQVTADPDKMPEHLREIRRTRFHKPDAAEAFTRAIVAAQKRLDDKTKGNF